MSDGLPGDGTVLISGGPSSTVALDANALDEAVAAFLSEWAEYFAEDPRGPIADNISILLAPSVMAYLKASNAALTGARSASELKA